MIIYDIIIFIIIFLFIFVIAFNIKLDVTRERDLLLWYNFYGQRKFVKLFKI